MWWYSLNLVGHHSGGWIAARPSNVLDVAIRMDGLTILIGVQIDR